MKKIGLIGYFGAGAFSDDLIEFTTKQLFSKVRDDLVFDSSVLKKCMAGTDIDYLNSLDLLVHCGGSLLGKCTHPPINSIESWASKLKIPFAIFGLGYRLEPDKESLNAGQMRRISIMFDKADVISLRGFRTLYWLTQNHISTSKVSGFADPVMACEIEFRRFPAYIMGNVRNTPHNEVQHCTTDCVQKFMAECFDWLIHELKAPLRLISFRHNVPDDNDLIGARRVQDLMKYSEHVEILRPNNVMQALNYMRVATFWFGQRLHPTIFAASHGIPFVGLEYQFEKMIDFMSTISCQNYIHVNEATLDLFPVDFFVSKYYRVSYWIKGIQARIEAKKKEITATAQKIVELL